VFSKDFSPILIFSTERMPYEVREAVANKAVLNLHPGNHVDLARMMATLRHDHNIRRVVCEGGGEVFRSLVLADLVDEIHLTICPRIFGGKDAPTLTGLAAEFLPRSTRCELQEMEVHDDECFLLYRVLRTGD
jgi:riboflavin biosynthesis pyrimidine reductase